uniref:Suppressor of forked domain-containing protein n=1 Tax=Micrurus corallinus TaxID=54390 RepID=A0A2D4FLR0_MICCO
MKSENMGKDTEAKNEQPADFSTEIMSVMEMEQSPDNSPAANSQEETVQDTEIPDTETLKTSDPENSFPADFDKFWRVVETNPQDFTGWVYLLQFVEQENNLPAARKAFDSFFTHYPYCYGYWKKYADLEKRHSNMKQSDEVCIWRYAVVALGFCEPNDDQTTALQEILWLPVPATFIQGFLFTLVTPYGLWS